MVFIDWVYRRERKRNNGFYITLSQLRFSSDSLTAVGWPRVGCKTTTLIRRDMDVRSYIQRHPVPTYFVLAFLLAWAGTFAAIGPKFISGDALQFTDALLAFLPMLIGPSLAGIVMT